MSVDVVIRIGNSFRRDDGVGLAVADEVAKRGVPGVRVVTASGEPRRHSRSVERSPARGRRRCGNGRRLVSGPDSSLDAGRRRADLGVVSSHAIGLPQAYAWDKRSNRYPTGWWCSASTSSTPITASALRRRSPQLCPYGGRSHNRRTRQTAMKPG